jgi:isoquinoline 1-oxidoreductase beta subunit
VSDRKQVSRRTFLQLVGGVGASLALGSFATLACADVDDKAPTKKVGVAFAPNALVRVDPDGLVTVTIICPDAGQGSRTSLAMLVAEEIDVDWRQIRVIQAPANQALYGRQGIGGSNTIKSMFGELRKVGAATRMMLVAAAAKTWNVDAATLKTSAGHVISADGKKSVPYGELTAVASTMPVPTEGIVTKKPEDFKIIGKGVTRIDNPNVVTGKALYGLDVKVPGMVYAVIARTPAFGAKVTSFDASAAKAVPGVIEVVQVPSGVAVVAQNTWAAMSGRKALKVEWDLGENAQLTSEKIFEALRAQVGPHKEMPEGSKVIEATFEFPFLAHATMEPMNAVADVHEDHVTIWTGTQQPTGHLAQVARMLNMKPEQITLNVMLLGGGFGRRLASEYIVDAVNVSQAIKKPVMVVWSREDDMKHDNYRPACHAALKGALDATGNPVGWSHQTITTERERGSGPAKYGNPNISYTIPGAGMREVRANLPIPTGAWRSVEHTLQSVANECFMDELAAAAGKDPFEFRKGLLTNDRLRHCLETAAEKAGWGTALPKGHGRGIACFEGYGSYAAHVVELSVEGKKIHLHRAICVVDCGTAINPKGVEAQMQGACTDGLSTALRAAITIDKGGVVENSWPDFQWMTLDAMPKVEVFIVPSSEYPGGMGEPGYPSVPSAVANAIYAATGKRVRKFPINIDELV